MALGALGPRATSNPSPRSARPAPLSGAPTDIVATRAGTGSLATRRTRALRFIDASVSSGVSARGLARARQRASSRRPRTHSGAPGAANLSSNAQRIGAGPLAGSANGRSLRDAPQALRKVGSHRGPGRTRKFAAAEPGLFRGQFVPASLARREQQAASIGRRDGSEMRGGGLEPREFPGIRWLFSGY
jgi:hypothetical protein